MSEVNHSPTPWATKTGVHGIICDSNRMIIVDTAGCSYNDLEKVNASYIVSCVNSHDALTAENARLKAANARLKAANAKMSEALLIIAGGKDARGNYEEVAWHMAQFAAEAIAVEGEKKMSDCFSCIHFGKCSYDPTYCHSWDSKVAEGGAK